MFYNYFGAKGNWQSGALGGEGVKSAVLLVTWKLVGCKMQAN